MINVKYGVEPTHDVITEVPCAVIANRAALADETLFNVMPKIFFAETITSTLAVLSYV
jgi:hypothetical protein